MTARSHETIRVGLRRIIRDQNVKPNMRMDSIKMLMQVEGLMSEKAGKTAPTDERSATHGPSKANFKRMRDLLAQDQERKSA